MASSFHGWRLLHFIFCVVSVFVSQLAGCCVAGQYTRQVEACSRRYDACVYTHDFELALYLRIIVGAVAGEQLREYYTENQSCKNLIEQGQKWACQGVGQRTGGCKARS